MGGVEYQVTKVDPTDPQTRGAVYQVHKVSEEIAATLGGKVYRARIINDPTAPTVAGKVYQIVLIGDPSDPAVKGKVYNAILTGGSEAVVVGPAVSPLVLPDAIADSLTYVKAFGGTEQNGTPTQDAPVDIVSNNGVLGFQDSELPSEYRRVLGYACDNDVLWQITGFHLRGSDTIRISFSVTAACNVFGCYQGTDATDNYDLYVSATSGSKYLRYGDGTYLSYWSSANMGQRFDVVFTPTGTSGMPQDSTWAPMTFESANNLLLAATTLTGTSSKLRGNLYGSFVVDGRLKLIPCERVSDGVLGYYDTYTGTFYEPTGTPTSLGYDFSYYSIKTSGTVETINVHSKNLFDKNMPNVLINGFPRDDGTFVPLNGFRTVIYPLQIGETYTITRVTSTPTQASMRVIAYNTQQPQSTDNGVVLSIGTASSKTATITVPEGYPYVATYVKHSNDVISDAELLDGFQIEQGSTATEYEPYFDGGTATAEMLLKVGNYQDEQEILSGAVTRNVGVKVFDGSEITRNASSAGNYYRYIADNVISGVSSIGATNAYCTHFSFNTGFSRISTARGTEVDFWFDVNTTLTDMTKFKQWLADQATAGTPVILLYPLATPTTESVAGQTLQVTDGDNALEITQASLDGLELEARYDAAVTLTVQEAEGANLDNKVTVTIQ